MLLLYGIKLKKSLFASQWFKNQILIAYCVLINYQIFKQPINETLHFVYVHLTHRFKIPLSKITVVNKNYAQQNLFCILVIMAVRYK